MPDILLQDRDLLVAGALVACGAIGWVAAMILVLAGGRGRGRGVGRSEVALVGMAVAVLLALTHLGAVVRRAPEGGDRVQVSSSGGGTGSGTCASVREGMSSAQVVDLLGEPSLTRSAEDLLGPGARVLVYEESRCAAYLVDDVVEHVE
jgi:hypothetical protein